MRPWSTVKSLDHTPCRKIRPVIDRHVRQMSVPSLSRYLTQGLKPVENPTLIVSKNGYAFIVYRKQIRAGYSPHSCPDSLFRPEIHSQPDRLLIPGRQKTGILREQSGLVHYPYSS